MVTMRGRAASGRLAWRFAVVLTGILAMGRSQAWGQVTQAAGAPPAVQEKLKAGIEGRYRAFAGQGGILLVPRRPVAGAATIEVGDSTIAVNGAVVTGAELRQRLGADADVVIELSYLEPSARRLLLFGASQAPPAPPPAEAGPVASPPPVAEPPRDAGPRRRSDARVRIGGSVAIERDEIVNGAVVVVLGSARVEGEVTDAVVVVGGDARIGPEAFVHGDVTVVGGKLEVDPKARVRGQINEIGLDIPRIHLRPFQAWGWQFHPFRSWWVSPSFNLFAVSLRMLLFGLLCFVLIFVAPGAIGRIERRVAAEPWKSGLVGLLAQLLFVPLLVLTVVILVVSIIGIPLLLLVPFALLAILFALLVGFAGVAVRLGRFAQTRLGLAAQGRPMALLLGLVVIWVLSLVGHVVALGGWAVWGLAAMFSAIGFLVEYLAWTVGLGAALLTRFGTRPSGGEPVAFEEPHLEPPPPVDPSLVDVNLK